MAKEDIEQYQFKKGQSGNKAGRPRGSRNAVTQEIREAFAEIVHGNIDRIHNDIKHMSGRDRVKFIIEFAKFVVPTLKATELEATIHNEVLRLDDNDWKVIDNE